MAGRARTTLRGRTPRQVADSDDWLLLEGRLRRFEYDTDLLAHDGQPGPDTEWLRTQLDMPADRDAWPNRDIRSYE